MIGASITKVLQSLFLIGMLLILSPQVNAQEIALGDSIALGIKQLGHLNGGAVVGLSPKSVYSLVATYPIQSSDVVILSCGASNNPSQLDYCFQSIDLVHRSHAKLVLLGVGSGIPNYTNINAMLLAHTHGGDVFIDGWSGVHPPYQPVFKQIRDFECSEWRLCAI